MSADIESRLGGLLIESLGASEFACEAFADDVIASLRGKPYRVTVLRGYWAAPTDDTKAPDGIVYRIVEIDDSVCHDGQQK